MAELLRQSSAKRIGIVAKHDWYLNDAIKILKRTPHEVLIFKTLKALEEAINSNSNFDYLFFPHISELLSAEIYENFKCVGFHTGDLPLDRGGSPIQNKILTGQYKTHVSAFKITGGIDAGPIYLKSEIDLSEGNIREILQKLSIICSEMILQIVSSDPTPEEQKGLAEIKSRRKASDSLIPNDLNSLRSIYDFIRMLDGLDYPNAHILVGEYIFEFTSAKLTNDNIMTNCVIRKK